jgi:hypothetical protein
VTRQLLGLFGIVLAVFGLANDSRWLIWTAAGVLGASILWRLVAARARRKASDSPEPPES